MIQVENLRKNYRVHQKEAGILGSLKSLIKRDWEEKTAVAGVSLQIDAGEIVGLVGANGAGKTTLVKMLAGIIHPTSGFAKVMGHIPWERDYAFRSQIALIMGQKASLWWDLPAADCFLLLKNIYQIPQAEFQQRLSFLCESLNVTDQLRIQIRRLSLGERMKMELIATLLHQPKVIFLDEPTIGLDLTSQKAIRKFLLDYKQQFNPAMILTSHYMDDIIDLCERVVIIKNGKFVYDGKLKEISQNFSQQRILTLHVNQHSLKSKNDLNLPDKNSEVIFLAQDQIKIKCHKEHIVPISTYCLENLSVQDLNIEGVEIADIIESIQTQGL